MPVSVGGRRAGAWRRTRPVTGVHCAAAGIQAHQRHANNVDDFPLVEDRPS